MPTSPIPTAGPRLLTALAGAQLLVALDFSNIYVAMPDMGHSLGFSATTLQWVVSSYAILFAGLLLLGGQLVDVLGGGRVFLGAQLLFAAASLAAGSAGGAVALLAARAGQGTGAAFLVPATLGLLNSAYPQGPRRDRALSVWGTTGAAGLCLGVAAGGALTDLVSWRWIFWVNLPIVAICLAAARLVLRGPAPSGRRPLSVVAALLGSLAVAAVVLVFTELAGTHPSAGVVTTGAVVAVVAAGLLVTGRPRSAPPLLPAGLLRVRTLRVACAVAALYMASFGAELYLVTLYLQNIRDYSPLAAGAAFLPLAGAIVVGNTLAGRLASRWTLRRLLAVAYLAGAAGLLLLADGVAVGGGYLARILPGLLLSGVGQGIAFTGMFITGTRDLPEANNGTGSALVTTTQYMGGSLGLALLVLLQGEHVTVADFTVSFLVTAALAATAAPIALRYLTPPARSGAPPVGHPVPDRPSGGRR